VFLITRNYADNLSTDLSQGVNIFR